MFTGELQIYWDRKESNLYWLLQVTSPFVFKIIKMKPFVKSLINHFPIQCQVLFPNCNKLIFNQSFNNVLDVCNAYFYHLARKNLICCIIFHFQNNYSVPVWSNTRIVVPRDAGLRYVVSGSVIDVTKNILWY